MTNDELRELMEEPPNGANHGIQRTASGWRCLSTGDRTESAKVEPRTHGTTYSYVKIRCRCDECRMAWAAYIRARRGLYKPPSL